jgi:hypothetical protein
MAPRLRPPRRPARDGNALLPAFFVAVVAMVGAVVAMAEIDDDWADLAAIAFLVLVAVLLLVAIGRLMSGDDDEGA